MTIAARKAADQMERDGIKRLPKWSSGKQIGAFVYRAKLSLPSCDEAGCHKTAGYSTPHGKRCFAHAIAKARQHNDR